MRQLTLVAFYGQKPGALADLIRECQQKIAARVGRSFQPYDMLQVHATIIGLERCPHSLHNKNLFESRGELREMDLQGFRAFLLGAGHLPFTVQIGGFDPAARDFESRGMTPHQRSFSIQGAIAVMMGWPLSRAAYPPSLDKIRRAAQSFNIQHQWHRQPTDIDNDFYLRLGVFEARPSEADVRGAEHELRTYLAQRQPFVQEVRASDLQFVAYEEGEETLPWHRCTATPLQDAVDPPLLFQ